MNPESLNILIVDDMQFSRESLRIALQKQGVKTIHLAENALQALKAVKKYHPEVILVDKMMPMVDGPTLIRKIRKIHPFEDSKIKIILLTADDSEEALIDAVQAGADHYLYKDATGEKIINCVEYIDTQMRAREIMQKLQQQEQKAAEKRDLGLEETVIINPDKEERQKPITASPDDLSYLIIDDELFAAESLKQVLQRMEIKSKVQIANNALEALKIHQKERVDIILVDYMMPKVDGIRLTQMIRKKELDENSQKASIVMITAAASIKKIEEAITAGVDEYLYKPPGTRDLLKHMETAFKKHNPQHQLSQVDWLDLF